MIIAVQPKQKRRAVFVALLAIILGALIGTNFPFPGNIDEAVRAFMTTIQTPYGDIMMAISTFLGSPAMDIIYVIILAVILLLADLKIPAIWTISTMLLGQGLMRIIKILVNRDRPVGHLLTDSGSSFPSQHTFGAFVVIFIMFLLVMPNISSAVTRILAKWAIITIGFMVMLSRLYLSAHFLSDVIAGLLFAYAWVILAAACYPKMANYLKNNFRMFQHEEI
ncbi:phosphatase PAP2 family protein [Convivina praedatoris]|uniref:Phosphatidic acid phosphatase type 2/haloperoxidase domain-containing protein n=1 Tax=Convivina praedatoris TaxID=2880963 RepID=A0ABM9D5H3_9LACO|nr:phosphatase PAP2 family protein [Convivina sp. LMG 32447]CAH1856043.1 hypothetical protein R078138_01251 [Convivina sp. LMG 32447]CAH1856271.1 hypothetical protein R077815_01365 [Convivina sp. LMG 32447]CAH1857109.1 hypothetical protein LMG032447_01446 [Convivina sp. LMG 32447]